MTTSIELSPPQKTHLHIMLNIELRNERLTPQYWHVMNGIFRQLTGHDHENFKHFSEGVTT